MKYFIYTITNPVDNKVFYVGRTKDIEKRKRNYLYASQIHSLKLREFITKILAKGLQPVFNIVAECDEETVVAKEIDLIKHYASMSKLLNAAHVKDFKYHSVKRGAINLNQSIGIKL